VTSKTVVRQELLGVLSSLAGRAEQQMKKSGNPLDTYVQPVDFLSLKGRSFHIVYGRNGTGKTHLFEAFYKSCEASYHDYNVLPVFIDMRKMELGPGLASVDLDQLLLQFYRQFIGRIIRRLEEFAEKTIIPTALEQMSGGKAADRKKRIRSTITNLNSNLSLQNIEERLSKYVRTVQRERKSSRSASMHAGASADVSGDSINANANAGIKVRLDKSSQNKETLELIYEGLAVIPHEKIRAGLEQLVELCGAASIVVLVDEWSALNLGVQPLLAEMIRKALGDAECIVLKIAGLRFYTRTSFTIEGSPPLGLQPTVHIFELADLDSLFNCDGDLSFVSAFLAEVVRKHASSDLGALRGWTSKQFQDYLCGSVFENAESYREMVRASEGNPRDFLATLTQCCATLAYDQEARITRKQVTAAAIKHFDGKAQNIPADEPARHLFNRVFERVVKNRSKLFLITSDKALADAHIQTLWHFRFIHLVCPSYPVVNQDGQLTEYAIYSMDYGKLVSLRANKATEEILKTIVANTENLTNTPWLRELLLKGLDSIKNTDFGKTLVRAFGQQAVAAAPIFSESTGKAEDMVPTLVVDDLLNLDTKSGSSSQEQRGL
jgi:hypothetical protein